MVIRVHNRGNPCNTVLFYADCVQPTIVGQWTVTRYGTETCGNGCQLQRLDASRIEHFFSFRSLKFHVSERAIESTDDEQVRSCREEGCSNITTVHGKREIGNMPT